MKNECECFSAETEPKKYYKVSPCDDLNNFYIEQEENLKNVLEAIMDSEEGHGYSIRVVYMSDATFKRLPEFTGF